MSSECLSSKTALVDPCSLKGLMPTHGWEVLNL
jgi:hypothetical protein